MRDGRAPSSRVVLTPVLCPAENEIADRGLGITTGRKQPAVTMLTKCAPVGA